MPAASLPAFTSMLPLIGERSRLRIALATEISPLDFLEESHSMIDDSEEHYESYNITDTNHHIIV